MTKNRVSAAPSDTHLDGQILQSKKKRMPRYSTKIDPNMRRQVGVGRKMGTKTNGSGHDEEDDEGCCDNAAPC